MMLFWRKLLFYIFFIIYLCVAPWLILRMLGYIWHPTSFRLVKTGLVAITTIPSQAKVYIDGKRASTLTPTTVRELIPGTHFLRIEKEGFKDYVGPVEVNSNQATALINIELTPVIP